MPSVAAVSHGFCSMETAKKTLFSVKTTQSGPTENFLTKCITAMLKKGGLLIRAESEELGCNFLWLYEKEDRRFYIFVSV